MESVLVTLFCCLLTEALSPSSTPAVGRAWGYPGAASQACRAQVPSVPPTCRLAELQEIGAQLSGTLAASSAVSAPYHSRSALEDSTETVHTGSVNDSRSGTAHPWGLCFS